MIMKMKSSNHPFQDNTAPHYKYHDDPFLIPRNFLNQRSFALSKESGRKAARFFLNKYPQLFYRDDAEPKIPSFSYDDSYNPELEYDESDLINTIYSFQVLNAIEIYKNLRSRGDVSEELKQSLLELVCFYNCNERTDPEYLEEAWFGRDEPENMQRKLWNDASFANDLFNDIENKTESTYGAMIRGLCKFNAGTQGFKLFEEAKEKGFKLDTNTYNHVIKIVPFVRDTPDKRWELADSLMHEMSSNGLSPNVNTFTELLQVLYRNTNWAPGFVTSLRLMSEMKRLKKEPTLACFYYLSLIHHRVGSNTYIMDAVLDVIEKLDFKGLRLRHIKDLEFFPNLMKTCYQTYNDLELAYRIHNIVTRNNNQRFIGNGFGEQTYYQNFFLILTQNDSFKNVMKWYLEYVPNVYAPSPTVYAAIISSMSVHKAYEEIPQFWNDIVSMEMVKDKTVRAFVTILSEVEPGSDKSFNESIVNVVLDIFQKVKAAADDNVSRPEYSTPTEL